MRIMFAWSTEGLFSLRCGSTKKQPWDDHGQIRLQICRNAHMHDMCRWRNSEARRAPSLPPDLVVQVSAMCTLWTLDIKLVADPIRFATHLTANLRLETESGYLTDIYLSNCPSNVNFRGLWPFRRTHERHLAKRSPNEQSLSLAEVRPRQCGLTRCTCCWALGSRFARFAKSKLPMFPTQASKVAWARAAWTSQGRALVHGIYRTPGSTKGHFYRTPLPFRTSAGMLWRNRIHSAISFGRLPVMFTAFQTHLSFGHCRR